MNVDLPVEYWPSSNTDGLASKSPSCSNGEKNDPNLYVSSKARILEKYIRLSPSVILVTSLLVSA